MPIINMSDPITIIISLIIFILVLLLAKETKRSSWTCILLLVFLTIIVGHSIEYAFIQDVTGNILQVLARCITMDFVFIFLSFISYLWIDDIESKERKTKTINGNLDWFWKKV